MKKILTLMLSLLLILSLSACGSNQANEGKEKEENKQEANVEMDKKLTEMIEEITQGIELPDSAVYDLDDELFEAYAFTKKEEGLEGVASEAQISTLAHSLVLIRSKDPNTEELAKNLSENANTRKWICVEAETGKVLYGDNYVFLVMTNEASYEGLKANFEKVTGIKEAKVLNVEAKDPYQ
ncbi:MAG: hypothetical protein Q4E50_06945 [Tissierellia bacterium]|nr:hypothetical protein [Tissierellia bacterium]